MMRLLMILLTLIFGFGSWEKTMAVNAFHEGTVHEASVEIAAGPDELMELERQKKITVRALRAWNRLPHHFMILAQNLMQDHGLDLLNADLEQINAWINLDESDKVGISRYKDDLEQLASFMEHGGYFDWVPVKDLTAVKEGALLRKDSQRWVYSKKQAQVIESPEVKKKSKILSGKAQPPGETIVMPATAEGDGYEFRISEQTEGTFFASLSIEGLEEAPEAADHYFKITPSLVLPESSQVKELEAGTLGDNYGPWSSDLPYAIRTGYVPMNKSIVIRVDAPEKPVIPLSERESRAGISHEVVGREFRLITSSEAHGEADIDFNFERWGEQAGTLSWTPREDKITGRPVGPRAVGVYMAYRVKRFLHGSEFGLLRPDFRRIGWVIIAMPGDIYTDGSSIYQIGQDVPLAGAGAKANWNWPVTAPAELDFELPENVVKNHEARVSQDMNHLVWLERESGRTRVILNGVPGKWYDDVREYSLELSQNGEALSFWTTLGDWHLPVINGVEGRLFERVENTHLSADGSHNIVVGRVSRGVNLILLNGEQIRQTDARISRVVLAEDGTVAWSEQDPSTRREKVMTSAGYEGPEYASIIETPRFAGKNSRLFYIVAKEDRLRYIVSDGQELMPTMGYGYKFSLTQDGARLAYVTPCEENGDCMVIDGSVGSSYERIMYPALFSPDAKRNAYVAAGSGDGKVLVVDGNEVRHPYGTLKNIREFTFCTNGKRWAADFETENNDYALLADGKEIARGTGQVRQIGFSPDGTRVAWIERAGRSWRILLDGKAEPSRNEIFDDLPPQFSPDGKHLVYFYRENNQTYIALFGGARRSHDLIPPYALLNNDNATYMAVDGNRIRRMTWSLSGK